MPRNGRTQLQRDQGGASALKRAAYLARVQASKDRRAARQAERDRRADPNYQPNAAGDPAISDDSDDEEEFVTFSERVRRKFVNGPIIGGAVIDPDTFDGGKSGLRFERGDDALDVGLDVYLALIWRCSATAARAVAGIAMLVGTYPDIATPGALAAVAPAWYDAEAASGPRTDAEIDASEKEFTELDVEECIDLGVGFLIAAKVNWWKTNHHTGHKVPQGYFKKATDMANVCVGATAKEDLEAIWRAVHWVDTKLVLHAFGIEGLTVDPEEAELAEELFALSDDAQLRISSNPAGTAKFADVWVGITQIEGDRAYAMHGHQFPHERAHYAALYARCCSGDPTLHMGSYYLCGKTREKLPEWSEGVVAWVVTCVSAQNSSSTLLAAQVFKGQTPQQTTTKAIKAYREGVAALMAEDVDHAGLTFGVVPKKAKK